MDHYTKTSHSAVDGSYALRNATIPGSDTTQKFTLSKDAVNTFDGYRNPYWRSQIRNGGNATTPASGVRRSWHSDWMSCGVGLKDKSANPIRTIQESYGHFWPDNLGVYDGTPPPAGLVTSVANRAIRKFLDKADSVRSSVEAGQDFGEYKETLESLVNPLGSLRKLTLEYFAKLGKLKRITKGSTSLRKALADTYLEYRFGWRPLALDIADAYSGLTTRSRNSDTQEISAGASDTYAIVSSGNWFPGSRTVRTPRGNSRVTGRYSVRFKGAIRIGLVNGQVPVLQVLQIDLPHFLPTAWDLLPYSFIVDYFTNVGDIVRAYSFRQSDLMWGCKTVRTEVRYESNCQRIDESFNFNPAIYSVEWENTPSCNPKATTTTFSRGSIGPDDLVPRFQFSIPVSKYPWINMAALLAGRSKSLVPFFK